jgi:hypothetical protein
VKKCTGKNSAGQVLAEKSGQAQRLRLLWFSTAVTNVTKRTGYKDWKRQRLQRFNQPK